MSEMDWGEEMQQARNTYEKELRHSVRKDQSIPVEREIQASLDGWDRCSATVLRLAFLKIMRSAPHRE